MIATKKLLKSALLPLGAAIGFLLLVGWLTSIPEAEEHRAVDDYSYESWDVSMELFERPDGGVDAHVVETIVPVFPEHDQNRGITRQLPAEHRGAELRTENIEVLDLTGDPYPYFLTDPFGPNPQINVGTDEYLHGRQAFVLKYDLNDVLSDEGEVYWNMVDLVRPQPIEAFSSRISFEEGLRSRLTGEAACYQGAAGSATACKAVLSESTGVLEQPPVELGPHEGVTLAAGLDVEGLSLPAQKADRAATAATEIWRFAAPLALLLAAAIASDLHRRRGRRLRGPVVAEYSTELSPVEAAVLMDLPGMEARALRAGVLQQATQQAAWLWDSDGHEGMALSPKDASRAAAMPDVDVEAYEAVFGSAPGEVAEGAVVELDSLRVRTAMSDAYSSSKEELQGSGLATAAPSLTARALIGLAVLVAAVGAATGFVGLDDGDPSDAVRAVSSFMAIFVTAWVLIGSGEHLFRRSLALSDEGLELLRHVLGLQEFIRVAEEDRIAVLQSAPGAGGRGAQTTDEGRFLLYEALLPFAVVFGQEKTWIKALDELADRSDDGLVARSSIGAIGAGGFDALGSASRSAVPSSSSSSSGGSSRGSSGGGSSGGGGGGGSSGGR